MRIVIIAAACALLAGCNGSQTSTAEQNIFGRVDCKRFADYPELEIEFEQAKAVCLPRAQAAAVAGTTAIPVGHGVGGAIASGIERGMAQREIGVSTAVSCMAERGYLFKPMSEHLAMCESQAALNKAASKRKITRTKLQQPG